MAGNDAATFTGANAKTVRHVSDPVFDDGATATLSVAENNADAASVGTVAATDADGDTLTYWLAPGGDASRFTISSTGEIKVASGVTLNYEAKDQYTVTALVTDGDDPWGQTFDTTAATVVSNTGQAQEASTIDIDGGTVAHSAANVFTTGDDANGYNLRNVELFVNAWGTVPLSGLTASIWSVTSGGAPDSLLFTLTNPASRTNGAVNVFTAPVGAKLERSTAYALVVRNSHTALSRLAVTTSNDEDSGAASGWSIADSHRTSLRDGWTIPQHSSMLFSVTASEYVPHDDAIAVTINVGNVNEPPTAAPADLAVTDQTSRTLSLSWTAVAAAAGGPDPNAYDVRWFEGSTDPAAGNEADWVEPGEEGGHSSPGAGVTTTLGGLEPDTAYRVQVRANSADGPGPWSSSVDGTTNDDPDITLTVSPTSVTEGNSATVTVRASRLVAENSDAVTVQVTAQTASTATSGVDYTAFTVLAITIPADTASAEESLTIATTEDTTHEGDETIVLGATVDGFGVIGATFTIIDDDFPSITIEGGSAVTEGTAATFTLTADQAPVANLTVNLTVSDVTGSDFVAAGNEGSKMVTITAGATTATYTVATVSDSAHEPNGSVTVAVAAGTGYTVGAASSAGVTVNDDDNDPPKVANEIPNQTAGAGAAFSYVFPANTFSDADEGDTLTYTATKGDGSALPMWLTFTAGERKFSGTPASSNIGTVSVKVTATDPSSASVSDTFDISVVALPVITVTAGSAVCEGTASSFTVTSSPAPAANLTVNLTVSEPDGSDFVAATNEGPKTVTITGGATTATFTVATVNDTTDEPHGSVTVAVATGTGYVAGTASSASVSVTDNENVAPTGSVTISGTVTQKQELTAVTTTLADSDGLGTLLYQWKRAGSDISGATSSKYTLVQDDVGRAISVTVSWTDGGGFAESLDSSATAAVANVNDDPTGAVTISGTATEGQTLTAVTTTIGDIDGLGVFSYQWKRAGTDITGETSSSYVLVQDDVGKVITVTVSYTDGQGTSESLSASTAAVANVNDDPTGAVTITGTPTQGQTLTAVTTTIRDVDGLGTFSYQWKRAGTDISGATSSTYTLVQDDVDSAISVTVSYTDGEGTAESLDSDATDAVANVNDAPTGAVTISGTATQNQTLTAVTSTIVDPDGPATLSFSYQWKRGNDNITEATSSTYVLKQADVGKVVSVTVSWTDAFSQAESLDSDATDAVADANVAPTVANPIADQTAGVSGAFSFAFAADTFADDDGDTLTYTATQNDASGSALPMWLTFTASTRTFSGTPSSSTTDDVSVKVTATDPGGLSVSDTFDIDVVDLPVITISGGTAVSEGTAATFPVTAAPAPSADLTVNLTVSEPEGSDFVAAANEGSKTATIMSSQTTATFTVATVGDTAFESDGSVSVAVAAGTGYVVGTTASASVTVSDDDPLVSNLGQSSTSSSSLNLADVAQEFTTGAHPAGYVLDSVGVNFSSAPSNVSVKIATGLPSATNPVATLANPTSLGAGTLTFTAPADTILSASTTYWVVVEGSSGQVRIANSGNEDAGGAAGWSIGNNRRTRADESTGAWTGNSFGPARIGVHGSLVVDEDPPTVVSATVLGTKLTIAFNERLAAAPNLVNGSFAVKKTPQSGTEQTVGLSTTTGPVVSGKTVVLTLASAVVATDTDVKVSYTKPGTVTDNAIKDPSGNAADTFTDQTVAIVPTITISAGTAVTEGTAAAFTVTASPAPSADLVVSLTVSDVAGSDFVAAADEGPKTVTITGGSTSATYEVDTETDSTHELKGSVTVAVAAGAGYVVGTASSAGVAVNDDDNGDPTGAVTISGTPTQGQTLTAVTSTIRDPDGPATLSFTYQWKRAGSDISGATSSTYVLVQADVDSAISVTVSYTDGEGHAESLDSDATDAVANVNDAPTGAVTISGTATQNQTLTAVTSTIVDPDGPSTLSCTYQWKHAGDDADTDISGATSSTYVLGQDDVGEAIKVTVSWTDDGGTAESLDSDATDAVANVNDAPKVANEIPNQGATVGTALSYVFPANTFSDDDGDTLTYSATKGDDMALPMWLSFTASERKFSGTPASSHLGTLSVKVTATDPSSASVSDTFDIAVTTLPVITITGGSAVTEGSPASFTVTASSAPTADLTVNLTVTDAEGSDFVAATNEGSKTVTIRRGQTTATFTVATVGDTASELDGPVTVAVAAGTGYNVGTNASAGVRVNDDDSARPQSASVSRQNLTLTFSRSLNALTEAESHAIKYALTITGSYWKGVPLPSISPEFVTVSGNTVTLLLPELVSLGSQARVSYIARYARGLDVTFTDATGAAVPDFSGFKVGVASTGSKPLLIAGKVEGTALTLTFDKDLDSSSAPAGSRFSVTAWPGRFNGAPRRIAGAGTATVSGNRVTVTLASAVVSDEGAVVWYRPAAGANPLRADSGGPTVDEILGALVKVYDDSSPVLVDSVVAGSSVVLYYGETLDPGSEPATSAFTVTVAGSAATVSGVAVSDDAVTLTLSSSVAASQAVTVTYTVPTTNRIQDLAGNDAAALSATSVTNAGPTNPGKPTLVTPTADDLSDDPLVLTIAFNRSLDPARVPDADAFALSEPTLRVIDVAVRGKKVELIVGPGIFPCANFKVSYTKPSSNALRSVWGTEVDSFSDHAATISGASQCATARVTADVGGDSGDNRGNRRRSMNLRFDRSLDRRRAPSAASFSVTKTPSGSGVPAPADVCGIEFPSDATQLQVLLCQSLAAGDEVEVSYRRSASDIGLWDDDGNQIAPFSAETDVAGGTPTVTAVEVVSDAGDDDVYALGEVISVGVTFSEEVDVVGAPLLGIDMDPADWGRKDAVYTSGSGTAELVFTHTVVEPNYSPQGIAVLADSLSLAGGTIQSVSSQADADLAHTGLGHDSDHKVDWQQSPPDANGNRPPVFVSTAPRASNMPPGFVNAPPGILVSLPLDRSDFSDPDGDELTFTMSASRDDVYVQQDGLIYSEQAGRVFFLAKTSCALADLNPAPGEVYETVVTTTATDPDGETAQATLTFRTNPVQTWRSIDPEDACPSVSGASVDGSTLVIALDGAVVPSYERPTAAEFAVRVDGAAVNVAGVGAPAPGDTTITLTLASPVSAGQAVTVSYVPGDNPVAVAFADQVVTNNPPEPPAPPTPVCATAPEGVTVPICAAVSGKDLIVTFSGNLAAIDAATADALRFSIFVNGAFHNGAPVNNQSPGRVSVSGAKLTVTLGTAVSAGDEVTIRYFASAAGNALKSVDGNALPDFTFTANTTAKN